MVENVDNPAAQAGAQQGPAVAGQRQPFLAAG